MLAQVTRHNIQIILHHIRLIAKPKLAADLMPVVQRNCHVARKDPTSTFGHVARVTGRGDKRRRLLCVGTFVCSFIQCRVDAYHSVLHDPPRLPPTYVPITHELLVLQVGPLSRLLTSIEGPERRKGDLRQQRLESNNPLARYLNFRLGSETDMCAWAPRFGTRDWSSTDGRVYRRCRLTLQLYYGRGTASDAV
jgi:hypothetical protein